MMNERLFYRRRLPHWQPPGATIFITWRLYGSLPRIAVEALLAEGKRLGQLPIGENAVNSVSWQGHEHPQFQILERYLDRAEHGPLWLKDERLASLVTSGLFHFDGGRYDLISFAVMANHVHVLATPREISGKYAPLRLITQGLKGYTSRQANRILKRTGQPFWQEESYDHWARSREETIRIAEYIENNPVTAGLVTKPDEWRWSSAWERVHGRLKNQEL